MGRVYEFNAAEDGDVVSVAKRNERAIIIIIMLSGLPSPKPSTPNLKPQNTLQPTAGVP